MTSSACVLGLLLLFGSQPLVAEQTKPAETCSTFASVLLPAEAAVAAPKQPPACASYRSYRGIGRKKNLAAARSCAWIERAAHLADLGQSQAEPTAWVVGGPLILAEMYFNGDGVPQNKALAMRFACEFEESTAKLAMDALAEKPIAPNKRFELCDYAATTFTMNFCLAYKQEMKDDRTRRFCNALRTKMTPGQQAAFDRLRKAQSAYVDQHANEVDQGGSIRAIRTMTSQDILNDAFRTDMVHFERQQWPRLSQIEVAKADAEERRQLHAALSALSANPRVEAYDDSITASGLDIAQKAWEHYRDAWLAFARLRYPAHAEAIRAAVVWERSRLLKTIR